MVPVADARSTFIQTTLEIFDRKYYPKQPLPTEAQAIPAPSLLESKTQEIIERIVRDPKNNQKPPALPTDVQTILFDYSPNLTSWAGITEVMDPNQDDAYARAIELSALHRLQQLGQKVENTRLLRFSERVGLLKNRYKRQLLCHVFSEAFLHATDPEKDRLIALASQLHSELIPTYPNWKKTAQKISESVHSVIENPVFQFIFYLTLSRYCLRLSVKALQLVPDVLQKITAVARLKFILKYQSLLYLASTPLFFCAAHTERRYIRIPLLAVAYTISFPGYLAIRLLSAPWTIYSTVYDLGMQSREKLAESIKTLNKNMEEEKRNWLAEGAKKALQVWLELSEQRTAPKNAVPA